MKTCEQEAREHDPVQARQGLRQPLVIACQTATAGNPAEGALDHPTPGQKHEALFGFGELDHLQGDAVLGGGLSRFWPGVTLVYPSQLHVLARHLLGSDQSAVDFR